ncbi:tumor protein p63-regulated gene 1-like protein isoform X2 [Homalodisca vitripennis]|nr:tumor protein p63-regulated gene 1-like protein isoform X2 [Homalodisca vitripennis]
MMSNQEVHFLEDAPPQDFTGTTLQLGEDKSGAGPSSLGHSNGLNIENDAFKHKRDVALVPWSGEDARDFFSHRSELIEKAIKECMSEVVTGEDGDVLGSWLLTEISLWDHEKERLVVLTSKCVLTIKYDFIAMRTLDVRRVPTEQIDTLVIGELEYPVHSLIPSRNLRGVRTMWNQGQPLTFTKKWNPFTSDIPWVTYTSHPLLWHKEADEKERSIFNVDDFAYHLVHAVEKPNRPCSIEHKPILLDNYVGLGSLIHNKNALGFFKVRGKFSF